MPSQMLTELSTEIEKQNTDHFGKFYMYAALLKMVTVRQSNSDFNANLPIYTNWGISNKSINIGSPSARFFNNTVNYQKKFDVKVPDFFIVLQKIILSYMRTGQLSDLIFMIEKMTAHLSAIDSKGNVLPNKSIYDGMNFESHKLQMSQLLSAVNNVTHEVQSMVDNSVHCALSGAVGFISLMAALTAGLSVSGVLLSLFLATAGGYSAYYYFQQAKVSFERMDQTVNACKRITEDLITKPCNNVLPTPNYNNFILGTVLAPLAYTPIVVREQMAVNTYDLTQANEQRNYVDNFYRSILNN
ncbi:MAG TPA: hypothetical protein VHD33_05220 [Legionellaceae bacterium]|nr:hypothetical protein [Legionellaceae bacterium]